MCLLLERGQDSLFINASISACVCHATKLQQDKNRNKAKHEFARGQVRGVASDVLTPAGRGRRRRERDIK